MVNPFYPDCAYAEDMPGIRTFSAFVPDSCQGCYFPADAPYDRCSHTGKMCTDAEGSEPHMCSVLERVGLCPLCQDEDDLQVPAFRNGRGILCCANGHTITEAEWAA